MLAGNVVSAAIREAQLQTQIEITGQLLRVQQQELTITEQRHRAGGVSDYDLRSQRTAVAQIEAMLPPLNLEADVVRDQLALLMGTSPANSRFASISLASLRLPEELPVSLHPPWSANALTFALRRLFFIRRARNSKWRRQISTHKFCFQPVEGAWERTSQPEGISGTSERH